MSERVCLLALLGLACLAGPAGAEPRYEWQWTIAPGILLSTEAPTLAALPDGTVLVCWSGGSTEKARDVQIHNGRVPELLEDQSQRFVVAVRR